MKRTGHAIAILLFAMFIIPTDVSAGDKQQFCNTYADQAVAQYNQGKQHNLPGIVPPAWSNDRTGHFNWCMAVPENFANSENAKRQAHLGKYLSLKTGQGSVLTGTATKVVGGQVGGAVAATPISIPRPIQVGKIKANALGTIEKTELLSLDNNVMHIRLYYKVAPSVADSLYGGAFLYDINLKPLNVSYKPTREHKAPQGSIDVSLLLPSESFDSATLEAFLMHAGKVIVKQYFKAPLRWNGTHGSSLNPAIDRKLKSTGNWGKVDVVPAGKQQPVGLDGGWGKVDVPAGQQLPVGLDPGRGP